MIYFAVYLEDNKSFSNLNCIGFYLNYFVYEVDKSLYTQLEFKNKRVVFIDNADVAIASRVAGANRDFIRVSGDFERLKKTFAEESLIPHKPLKWTYYLTDEDKTNALSFMKLIIKDIIYNHDRSSEFLVELETITTIPECNQLFTKFQISIGL